MKQAIVIDAGVGNLGNLARALRHVGAECRVTTDPDTVAGARCLVLPGVGAFRPPREKLRGALEDALRRALDEEAWLLGICVGYQLLFEHGEEFGSTDGLGLLPGVIKTPAVEGPPGGGQTIRGPAAPHRLEPAPRRAPAPAARGHPGGQLLLLRPQLRAARDGERGLSGQGDPRHSLRRRRRPRPGPRNPVPPGAQRPRRPRAARQLPGARPCG